MKAVEVAIPLSARTQSTKLAIRTTWKVLNIRRLN
jgi:hypothetical protein